MSMEILTGLPGSGKSERLIGLVQSARDAGQEVRTIACSDSLILQGRRNITENRRMGSRSGLNTKLDRFEPLENAVQFLNAAESGWLLAFDEAQHFGPEIVNAWCAASDRGVRILIASPSHGQLELLLQRGHRPTALTLTCQKCGSKAASEFFCRMDENKTEAVCDGCYEKMKKVAEKQAARLLRKQAPHPGKKIIYQPVELPACRNWEVIREDSERRFEIVRQACAEVGLLGRESSYLDIGCNTGFFCHRMSQAGFRSTGVDVVKEDIELARLLGAYSRRDYAKYVASDAYIYLRHTQEVRFDVISAFSVFQWIMIQKTAQHGLHCMNWLFRKSKCLCVLEMGESTEDHYVKRIGMKYDSVWIRTFMETSGEFERVELYEGEKHGLKRDLFLGIKHGDERAKPRAGR